MFPFISFRPLPPKSSVHQFFFPVSSMIKWILSQFLSRITEIYSPKTVLESIFFSAKLFINCGFLLRVCACARACVCVVSDFLGLVEIPINLLRSQNNCISDWFVLKPEPVRIFWTRPADCNSSLFYRNQEGCSRNDFSYSHHRRRSLRYV